MKLLRAETARSNFREVLQLKQNFAVSPFAITVDHSFAFFIIFSKRPRTDRLNMSGSKSRPAVGIENVTTA
jgi:hypothetical protein